MRQVREEAERGAITPLQVVDDEQHRLVARQVQRHPEEPVQNREGDIPAGSRVVGRSLEEDPRGGRGAGQSRFGERSLNRLREIRANVDPEGLFHANHPIDA